MISVPFDVIRLILMLTLLVFEFVQWKIKCLLLRWQVYILVRCTSNRRFHRDLLDQAQYLLQLLTKWILHYLFYNLTCYFTRSGSEDRGITSPRSSSPPCYLLAVTNSPILATSEGLPVLHLSPIFSGVFNPIFFQPAPYSWPSFVTSPYSFRPHAHPFHLYALNKSYNIGILIQFFQFCIVSSSTLSSGRV